MALESWRKVLRGMFLACRDDGTPFVTDNALVKLRAALLADSDQLIQGHTTDPPPLHCVRLWPVEGACLIGYCGMADGLTLVWEVEKYFAELCYATDQHFRQPAVVGHLLDWYDDTPRDEMRHALLIEIALERDRRSMLRGCAGDVQRVERVGV